MKAIEVLPSERTKDLTPRFSKVEPNMQVIWGSTSLGTIMTCPRKYYLGQIEGWTLRQRAIALEFGILFHNALEHYGKLKATGAGQNQILRETVRFAMAASEGFEGDETEKQRRTRWTLIRSIVWYIQNYAADPFETLILADGSPALEVAFRLALPIANPDGEPYIIRGFWDRVGTFAGEIFLSDFKTTTSTLGDQYFKGFNPNFQASTYIFAGQIALPQKPRRLMIDGVHLAQGFNRYMRGITERHEDQVVEWLRDVTETLRQAERYAEANYWPKNETACGQYGGCEFKEICSRVEAVRETWLKADFVKARRETLELSA